MMKEGDICPKCCEGRLVKPKKSYRIFEGRRHPDFICEHCGAFLFQKLPEVEPLPLLKKKEAQEAKKQEKFDWTKHI
jgi:Fe2+ or Zn2+ uptake regulation protein